MKSNRFPFHFDSFKRIKETKMKHSFRLRCKNDGRMESRIDMCINALEIVHAFTKKTNQHTVRWGYLSVCLCMYVWICALALKMRFFFANIFFLSLCNNTLSRWILLYFSTVGAIRNKWRSVVFTGYTFFLAILSF